MIAHPLDAPALPVPVDRTVEHGDRVTVGVVTLEVIHLRGHTPGLDRAALRRRDDGSTCSPATRSSPAASATPRRTPSGSPSSTRTWSERIFDRLPDETWVYPGHGKDTTLGAERPSLPEWRARGW